MAFLVVYLEEDIYIHPPREYFCLLQNGSRFNEPRLSKTSRKMVLHLRTSLFGLKQSPHVWYGTFHDFVISIASVASCVNGEVFVHHDVVDHRIVVDAVVLYVGDLLIIANKGWIGNIKYQMERRFGMHDLGTVCIYLGMNNECNRERHPGKRTYTNVGIVGIRNVNIGIWFLKWTRVRVNR